MFDRFKRHFWDEVSVAISDLANWGLKLIGAIFCIGLIVVIIALIVMLVEGIQDRGLRSSVGLFLWLMVAGVALPLLLAAVRALRKAKRGW